MSAWAALWVSTAMAGDLPSMYVDWKKDIARVHVVAPAGEYLQPDGPVSGWVSVDAHRLELAGTGRLFDQGLLLGVPGQRRVVQGELRMSLCKTGGDACRLVDVGFIGQLEGKRGRDLRLSVHAPGGAAQVAPEPATADEAFAQAQAQGKPVLIDFGAVWCPPCNLLSAQVLHDPDNEADLAGVVLLEVDVDRPESWPLKDRYHVGSYPTVVLAGADGAELDRHVGYVSEGAFLGWLAGAAALPPVSALPPAASCDGPTAAGHALRLARNGRLEAAAPYIERAALAEGDGSALRTARLLASPSPEDARWLLGQGAPGLVDWAFDAFELVEAHPDLVAPLTKALTLALGTAPATQAADLLYLLAKLAPGEESPALYAAAASALRTVLVDQPALDRGHWTFLARLHENAGDNAAAGQVYSQAIAAYPEEFTFHYALAGHLLRTGRPTAAQQAAAQAVGFAYGDNRLRAVERQARAMHWAGDAAMAVELIDRTLAEAQRPAAGTDVRTFRYLTALETARAEILGAAGE